MHVTRRRPHARALWLAAICACAAPMTSGRPPAPFAASGIGPLIIAHRGGSLEAPENTLASVRRAVACGSDWQEVDVTLSADGVPVVIHDDMLERTTNGAGPVGALSAAALAALDASTPRWDTRVAGEVAAQGGQLPVWAQPAVAEPVPRLAEVLAVADARLMIELKAGPGGVALARAVVAAVARAGAGSRVALGSFDPDLLAEVHRLDPGLPLVGIVEEAAQVRAACSLPIQVLAVSRALLPTVLEARPPQVAVWTWTLYAARTAAEVAAMGVEGIITDAPAAVATALRGPLST